MTGPSGAAARDRGYGSLVANVPKQMLYWVADIDFSSTESN